MRSFVVFRLLKLYFFPAFGCIDGELRIDGWVKEDNIDKLLQRNASGFTLDVKAKTIDDFEKFIDTYNYKDGVIALSRNYRNGVPNGSWFWIRANKSEMVNIDSPDTEWVTKRIKEWESIYN